MFLFLAVSFPLEGGMHIYLCYLFMLFPLAHWRDCIHFLKVCFCTIFPKSTNYPSKHCSLYDFVTESFVIKASSSEVVNYTDAHDTRRLLIPRSRRLYSLQHPKCFPNNFMAIGEYVDRTFVKTGRQAIDATGRWKFGSA